MIEGGCIDGAEVGQVILVRRIVAVPSNHIKGGMVLLCAPESAVKLMNDCVAAQAILKCSCWAQEVSGSSEAICTWPAWT